MITFIKPCFFCLWTIIFGRMGYICFNPNPFLNHLTHPFCHLKFIISDETYHDTKTGSFQSRLTNTLAQTSLLHQQNLDSKQQSNPGLISISPSIHSMNTLYLLNIPQTLIQLYSHLFEAHIDIQYI